MTPPPLPTPTATARAAERRGLALGLLGVLIFAMTLPMTRLAVGPQDAPQLPPAFVTAGRAALAGLLSLAALALWRAPVPPRRHWPALAGCAAGTVLGFPLLLALALRQVDAMHAAVVTGVLPLATAALAAVVQRQRPSAGFWLCAIAGCAIVLGYAAVQGGGRWVAADGLLLLAVLSGAVGYVAGARVSAELPAAQVICWVLVGSLPLTLPAAWATWPTAPARASAWAGFAYVSVFSMWLGFFAWYRGLALGGTVRVSQVQLLQPFAALLFAVPVLGERLDPATVGCALAVIATVLVGRRLPVGTPRALAAAGR
ncbi:DMT family transporter [Piscinibacter sakaiensis]|uniref:Permease of the drug/metabolite transporter DMT superfamily n=1 Tax=Piscinibacter sakaiensis TaxID=1547922 RepID=A0A0K8P0A5_PISS1|nr:DMT family transporter [Piscinibacter sakaiensis]GAP36063.1 permease of the drug/metabolite transporter DMT superfamily [Piscinibacter sakaiensis]